jgi:hypothetical protein
MIIYNTIKLLTIYNMESVKKAEVYKVLETLLGVPVEELEKWTDEELRKGIRRAYTKHLEN